MIKEYTYTNPSFNTTIPAFLNDYPLLFEWAEQHLERVPYLKGNNELKTPNGSIQLKQGMRCFKVYQKVLNLLKNSVSKELFNVYSLQLQKFQKDCVENNLSGTFCLSIHPMDFLTLSDNLEGWNNCLSLTKDTCNQIGTLDMLYSDCVIVAYLKSNNRKYNDWNSKKWRQLFVVDKRFILGLRQYPFRNENLEKFAFEKIAENYGICYLNPRPQMLNEAGEVLWPGTSNRLYFETNAMYNDTLKYGAIMWTTEAADNPPLANKDGYMMYNYSAKMPLHCVHCGKELKATDEEDVEWKSALLCAECHPYDRCIECGKKFLRDELIEVDSYHFCPQCYEKNVKECSGCGNKTPYPIYRLVEVDNMEYTVPFCYSCLHPNVDGLEQEVIESWV